MKKIGCLTFHASYNYGSALQAYALQTVFCKLGEETIEYKIINYRIPTQKRMYKNCFEKIDIKSLYQRVFLLGKRKQLEKKEELFEKFFLDDLILTEEASTVDELKRLSLKFDSLVVGSDQIWNLHAKDFDWCYFLEFTNNPNKYTYAISCGPVMKEIPAMHRERIVEALESFRCLSVRDDRTFSLFAPLVAGKNVDINVDPTLLLEKNDWLRLIKNVDTAVPKEKFILFYDLSRNKENWKLAKRFAKKMRLKLLITSVPFPRTINEMFGTYKKFDVGPKEFLLLLQKSEFVITSSFHGAIFSLLFQKRFAIIVRDGDNRLNYLINRFHLNDHRLDESTIDSFDYDASCHVSEETICSIRDERQKGISYLKNMINCIKSE